MISCLFVLYPISSPLYWFVQNEQVSDYQEFTFGRKKLKVSGDVISHNNGYIFREVNKPVAIKFYYDVIELEMYRIGSKACLHLQDADNNSLKLILRSYFSFRKDKMAQVFQEILDFLWDRYFAQYLEQCSEEIQQGKSLDFGRFRISKESIKEVSLSGKIKQEVRFAECKVIRKYKKTLIYSTRNQHDHVELDVRWDWNAYLVEKIVEELCRS